jgi:4-hydroxy-L-threonine phosphate dehydrogenase PdxA
LGCNRTARIATHWYHHTLYFTQAERVEQGLATEADLMNLSSDCLGVSYLAPHIAFQTPFASITTANLQDVVRLLVAGEGVHFLPPPAL